jgi:hypothetical protein
MKNVNQANVVTEYVLLQPLVPTKFCGRKQHMNFLSLIRHVFAVAVPNAPKLVLQGPYKSETLDKKIRNC